MLLGTRANPGRRGAVDVVNNRHAGEGLSQ